MGLKTTNYNVASLGVTLDTAYAINEFDTSSLFSNFEKVTDSYGNVFVRIPRIYIKKVDTTGHKAWYASRRSFTGDAYLPKCLPVDMGDYLYIGLEVKDVENDTEPNDENIEEAE